MQRDEINILIIDDDAALGKVLKETFTRAGFKATHAMKPDEALSIIKLQSFHAAIIDCMLPKMNGRLLAKKIREELHAEFPILLMSGIYKDKSYAREAMQETGAKGFLSKPFELKDMLSAVEQQLEGLVDAPLAPMQSLLTKETISHKERIKAINDANEVHGFDLPWIFSLLLHPRVNGHLNIITPDGEVCGIGVQAGNIVQVNQKDSKSYFGVLMVEYGFVSQEDLDAVMKVTGKTKKMGERLVEANVLSPHAIQIVMAEQQGLRLSRTISNDSVKVNFIESDEIREDAVTNRTNFTELLNEWMISKIKVDWLKAYYLPWMRFNVKQGPDYSPTHRVFTIPVVQRAPQIAEYLLGKQTLEQALADTTFTEEVFYPALHALIVSRVVRFGEPVHVTDNSSQKKRLSRLLIDLEKQNYFERLNILPKSKDADVKRSYHDLAKILHPDKLPADTAPEIRDLTKKCFALITTAYDVVSDPEKKAAYLLEKEKGRAESILQAEQLMEDARRLLTKGDFKKAHEAMEKAVSLAPPTTEARLLHMWSRLKTAPEGSLIPTQIRDELTQIAPEDRHSPTYYFVRGVMMRMTGEFENAKKNLQHAVSLDPDFIDARREIMLVGSSQNADSNKPVDLLRGDLKDVVGLLFKKKK
jgi:CheY-like chemotaxis protein/curved DNA-binding protein CbpA